MYGKSAPRGTKIYHLNLLPSLRPLLRPNPFWFNSVQFNLLANALRDNVAKTDLGEDSHAKEVIMSDYRYYEK
jgi:hypothetical protein